MRTIRVSRPRVLRTFAAGLSLVLMAGCAAGHNEWARRAEAMPALAHFDDAETPAAVTPRPSGEILRTNEAMRAFTRAAVRNAASAEQRMRRLSRAVLHPGSLGLRYNDRMTRTAEEAFSTANGNCLTLSVLFVALAREAKIDAAFYEVDVLPEWTRAGDIVFSTRHVNVGGDLGAGGGYVMDFYPYRARREINRRKLTDRQAIAQYYNNIGAELLADNDLHSAYLHFREGLRLAPRLGFLWSNIAVVYARNQQHGAAEAALQHAIALDHRKTSALSNLAGLYKTIGRDEEAAQLTEKIAVAQRNNPYFQYVLSERDFADERYADALKRLELAISLKPHEPMFYQLAADTANVLNKLDLAAEYGAQAASLKSEAESRMLRN
ncbi:MAG: transglutaminase domain-containing protein [Pseudomonadota bacterium]